MKQEVPRREAVLEAVDQAPVQILREVFFNINTLTQASPGLPGLINNLEAQASGWRLVSRLTRMFSQTLNSV